MSVSYPLRDRTVLTVEIQGARPSPLTQMLQGLEDSKDFFLEYVIISEVT